MTLLLALILLAVSPHDAYAAVAIATCESGDTVTFGTYDWRARSATADGGAFQFNDSTWRYIVGDGRADYAAPLAQTDAFVVLFEHGDGLQHWSASGACWSKWIDTAGNPVDRTHYSAFVRAYWLLSVDYGAKQ
jgi:hypothetical protein